MDSFIYSGSTRDRIPVAVCGFCAEGKKERILRLLRETEGTVFGPYTAGYVIDYRLNEMIHTLLAEVKADIAVLGASAAVPDAEGNTGGIFGDLSGRPLSSEAQYGVKGGMVYGVRPGYMAFCAGSGEDGRLGEHFFAAEGREGLIGFYHALSESGKEFLLISDGSGEGSFGMAAVRGEMVTLEETAHRSCARRDFRGIRRIGLFGGTFDPIHYGHLTAAEAAREALGLELVVFMPNGNVPYRWEPVTDRRMRYEMAYLAVRNNPDFCVSDLELRREGASFTADTVKELKGLCDGDAELTFLLGADVLPSLPRWKDFSGLSALCRFAVLTRPGYSFDDGMAGELRRTFHAELSPVPVLSFPVSSSEIRERAAEGRSIRYLLPEAVAEFIDLHRLYSAIQRYETI